jgi:hypothetical protein
VTSDTTDIVLSAFISHESFKKKYIGDSGASYQYCNSDEDFLIKNEFTR